MKIFKYKISSDNGKIELKTYQAKQIHLHVFQFALESTTHDYMTINTPSCLEIITLYELSPSQIKKSQSYMEKLFNVMTSSLYPWSESKIRNYIDFYEKSIAKNPVKYTF